MRRLFLLPLLLVLASPGCDGDPPESPTLPQGQLSFTEIAYLPMSGLESQTRQVVRTNDALNAVWDELYSLDDEPPDPPTVNFDNTMVLVVGSGEQPDDCYEIAVDSVTSDGSDIVVTVTETGPTIVCSCAQVTTSPAQAVTVARADQVTFNNLTAETCNDS